MFTPLEMPLTLGVLGQYEHFNQCVYMQNIGQSEVVLQDPNSILFCIKDYKNNIGVEE
jgi:hypothetical protein